MSGVITVVFFLIFLALRASLMHYDVEFLVFIFFIVLLTLLLLTIRYLVLRNAILKIWFIYSLFFSLINLNINLLNKLVNIMSLLKFKIFHNYNTYFSYYLVELNKVFSARLLLLNNLRLKTFAFFFISLLFNFELRVEKKTLSQSGDFTNLAIASLLNNKVLFLTNSVDFLFLNSLFILSYLRNNLIHSLVKLSSILFK